MEIKIVKAYREQCQWCEKYKPVFDDAVKESGVESESIDVTKDTEFAKEYLVKKIEIIDGKQRFEFYGVPMVMRFENDKPTHRLIGFQTKEALQKFIKDGSGGEVFKGPETIERNIDAELKMLYMKKGEMQTEIDMVQMELKKVNDDIIKILKLKQ